MKINDLVLDKYYGIGIVTQVNDEKILVTFDLLTQISYEKDNKSLKLLEERIIKFLNKYCVYGNYSKGDIIIAKEVKYTNLEIENDMISFTTNDHRKIKIEINPLHNSFKMISNSYGSYSIAKSVLWLLNEQITMLNNLELTTFKEANYLIKLTLQLVDNFFNLELFKELSAEIEKKEVSHLIIYCQRLMRLELKDAYKTYFLLLVANNTTHLPSLCLAFEDNNEIRGVLLWALKRSTYTYESKFPLNTSIQLLKEDRCFEWVDLIAKKGVYKKILNPSELESKIFQSIIQNAEDVMPYWPLVNDYIYRRYYQNLILNNTNKENLIKLLEQDLVEELDYAAAQKLDLDTFTKYTHLMDRNTRREYVKAHYEELLKVNPKKIIDLLVIPKETWVGYDDERYLMKAVSHLPNNQYLKSFLENGINNRSFFEPEILKNNKG